MSAPSPGWLDAVPSAPVTRFAPSPTGELHLGHVANAVWTWGVARAKGGTVLLRIEDHDRGRSHRTFEAGILQDLEWLELEPDATCLASLCRDIPSPWRQSDSAMAYRSALRRLAGATAVYGCTCSRADIARAAAAGPPSNGQESCYPGTCRTRRVPIEQPGAGIRALMADRTIEFADLLLGPRSQVPASQCGDLLLRDSLGNWTYQFAVTVDDQRQEISLVIRGADLLDSTGRQILLGQLLGRATPAAYLHHPLIVGEDGQKLSKRDRSLSLRELREAGTSRVSVLRRAAERTGLPRDLWWW